MIDRPTYTEKIMAYTDAPFVKILTGVRRCGKSTILKMIMDKLRERGVPTEQIVSYRFDSMEYEDMTARQMYAELKGRLSPNGKTYFFLDEVQELKDWEKVVNSLQSDFDVDLYVTGSNSRMMSSEISTYLTGRYVAFVICGVPYIQATVCRGWKSPAGVSGLYPPWRLSSDPFAELLSGRDLHYCP